MWSSCHAAGGYKFLSKNNGIRVRSRPGARKHPLRLFFPQLARHYLGSDWQRHPQPLEEILRPHQGIPTRAYLLTQALACAIRLPWWFLVRDCLRWWYFHWYNSQEEDFIYGEEWTMPMLKGRKIHTLVCGLCNKMPPPDALDFGTPLNILDLIRRNTIMGDIDADDWVNFKMPHIRQWCGHCKKPTRSQNGFLGDAQDAHDRHLEMLAQEETHHRLPQRGISLEGDPMGLYYAGYDEIIDPDESLMDDEWADVYDWQAEQGSAMDGY